MKSNRFNFKLLCSMFAFTFAGGAQALDLSSVGYYTYGNTNSYSLPIAAYQYDLANHTGTGPGNPYYINSTPGAIKDLVVIYTGASGSDVTTNAAGFENSYQTPNGSSPIFASTAGTGVIAPTGTETKGIATTYTTTWDASLLALKGFLSGGDAVFLFNNNDTNADQNLAIWAKLWITSDTGVYNNRYLYLSNEGAAYGQGGVPLGDATTYNPGNVDPAYYLNGGTDYILSGGKVCVSKATGAVASDQTLCQTDKANYEAINHNLGANQVAYAGMLPLLNQYLDDLFGLSNEDLSKYSLHLQLNLGCDTRYLTPDRQGNCPITDTAIDNGFEQLFLASTNSVFVPEPGSIALIGIALAGFAVARRRRT